MQQKKGKKRNFCIFIKLSFTSKKEKRKIFQKCNFLQESYSNLDQTLPSRKFNHLIDLYRIIENSIWISRSILRGGKSPSSIVNFQLKNRGIRIMDTSNPATNMYTYIHIYIYTRTLEQNKVGQAWRHTTWSGKASSFNFWSPLQMATRLIEIYPD